MVVGAGYLREWGVKVFVLYEEGQGWGCAVGENRPRYA